MDVYTVDKELKKDLAKEVHTEIQNENTSLDDKLNYNMKWQMGNRAQASAVGLASINSPVAAPIRRGTFLSGLEPLRTDVIPAPTAPVTRDVPTDDRTARFLSVLMFTGFSYLCSLLFSVLPLKFWALLLKE